MRHASRYTVFALCRAAQQVYAGEREAVLQAAQAARALAARLPRRHRRLRAPLYVSARPAPAPPHLTLLYFAICSW